MFNHVTDILQFAPHEYYDLSQTFQSFKEASLKQWDVIFCFFVFSSHAKKNLLLSVPKQTFLNGRVIKAEPSVQIFFESCVSPSDIPCRHVSLHSFFE